MATTQMTLTLESETAFMIRKKAKDRHMKISGLILDLVDKGLKWEERDEREKAVGIKGTL